MKTIKFYTFALIMSALTFTSCGNDDDGTSTDTTAAATNSITVAGTTEGINRAYIKGGGQVENADGVYNYEIYFLGEGISVDANDNFVGQGNLVFATIYTSSQNGLSDGTYEYRTPGGAAVANTIRLSSGGLDLDFDDPNGFDTDNIYNGSSGTIIINGSGTNAKVTLDITATSGDALNASHDGVFTVIE